MYTNTILALLILVIVFYCIQYFPARVSEWWDNSALKGWALPLSTIAVTIAVAFGIKYEVLNWGAIFLPVLLGFPYILGMILGIWYNMKNAGQELTFQNGTDAKKIAYKCLTLLGCQPEMLEDGAMRIKYQGETFVFEFSGWYVRIWDPLWADINKDDPDAIRIKEAINNTNFEFGPTIVMSAPNKNGGIGLHSRQDIMLHPACPDNVQYLRIVLDAFFHTKESVRRNFQQLKSQQQQEQQSERRPVGFNPQYN